MSPKLSLALAIWLASTGFVQSQTSERLPAFDLLPFHTATGEVRRAESPSDWQRRRDAIVASMESVMGPLPGEDRRVELEIQIHETTDMGNYTRRLISYQSEPDSRTPAYLCVPSKTRGKRFPAVLCLHPTDNRVGHQVVVGLGGKAGRQYAAELAERGYVTISPAYPHLANYWPNLGKLGYVSGTMKAIWDNSRAIDVLQAMDEVDVSHGVGAIGHSLGGHNAIYSAVFEPRISVVASSCGFDSYRDYYDGAERVWFFGKGWCQIRYMPRLSNYRGRLQQIPFDFPELLAAIAPRPIYVHAPKRDSNFRWRSVDRCVKAAEPIYAMLGAAGKITVDHPDGDHNFPEPQRQAAYAVIDSVLRP